MIGHCLQSLHCSEELKQAWWQEALLLRQGHRLDLALLEELSETEIITLVSEGGCESEWQPGGLCGWEAFPPCWRGSAFPSVLVASQKASHKACRMNPGAIEMSAFLWVTFSQRQLTWRFQHKAATSKPHVASLQLQGTPGEQSHTCLTHQDPLVRNSLTRGRLMRKRSGVGEKLPLSGKVTREKLLPRDKGICRCAWPPDTRKH